MEEVVRVHGVVVLAPIAHGDAVLDAIPDGASVINLIVKI